MIKKCESEKTIIMVTITIFLKEIREKKGLSIRQLALMSGISKSQISKIERGEAIPSILVLCQLADALHVEPEALYEYRKV